MNNAIVHIGYHKTASSWLQQSFFPALSDSVALFEHPVLWDELMLPSGLEFDVERCRAYIRDLSATARAAEKLCVFSSERLSGNPHSGGYDAAEMARRVKDVFDTPRIIVVVREQGAMLRSNYKQYIKMGGVCTLEEYLMPPHDGRIPLFRLDNFCYHHLVAYYHQLFGSENLLVLPYELLRSEPQAFVDAMLDFMGLARRELPAKVFEQGVNVSMNDIQVVLKRWVNKLSGGDSLHPVKPLAPGLAGWLFGLIDGLDAAPWANNYSMRAQERIETLVGNHYRDSNRQLQQLLNLDLAALGYRL